MPDVQVPAVYSGTVQLATTYEELLENTLANSEALLDAFLDAPAPILAQILENQTANLEAILEGLGTTAQGILAALTQLPTLVQAAFEEFAEGNLVGGLEVLFDAVFELALFTTDTLLPPLQDAILGPLFNTVNAVAVLTDPANIFNGAFGLVGPVLATVLASAQAVEDVIEGDPDTLTALINAPATITDGLLNGFDFPGLLSPPDPVVLAGPIGFALDLRQQIADAITPEPLSAEAAVNELPADTKLVPLDVNPGPAPAVEESDEDATNGNGTVLEQPDTSSLTQDKQRKGPLSTVRNSFKATPGATADSAGESTARPQPIKSAVEGVTGTIKSVRDGVRDSLGLSPKAEKAEAADDKTEAADAE
jgi:hypothetical protein